MGHLLSGSFDGYFQCTLAAYTFCGVSLLTLPAISVDRLLALLLGLRYRQVVTVKTNDGLLCLLAINSFQTKTYFTEKFSPKRNERF